MSTGSSVVGLPQRIIIDASMMLGLAAFMVSLWGYGRFLELLIAAGYGLVVALISFLLISQIVRLLQKYFYDFDEEVSQTVERPSFLSLQSVSSSSQNTAVTNPPTLVTPDPHKWFVELIDTFEWKVLQDVCIAIWYAKGYLVRRTVELKSGHFYLYSKHNRVKPLGLIMFRNASSAHVSVEELDDLYLIQTHDNLPLGILTYTGKLSRIAKSYCQNHDIKLQNTNDIYEDLQALTRKQRTAILQRYVKPDCAIPSCPSCRVKLIKRQEKKSGKLFWGCVAYPQCRHAVPMS